jgi:hypothetical protein
MNSFGKASTIIAKLVLLLSVVCLAAIFLINGTLGMGSAQSEGRVLEDTIPKHLPIKVKIKKEKEQAFKDVKNEKWMRDFELEVTNTGDKPIYFLDFVVTMPEITAPDGSNMAFPIQYGRIELGNMGSKATPDDIPIKPGETYVLKAYDSSVQGWDNFRKHHNKPDAKKLTLNFQMLSFGDGTGFWTTGGIPFPEKPKENSGLGSCEQEQNKSGPILTEQRLAFVHRPTNFSGDILPANFLLANFLSSDSSESFPSIYSHKTVALVLTAGVKSSSSRVGVMVVPL